MNVQNAVEKFAQGLSLAFDKLAIKTVKVGTVKDVDGYKTCTVVLDDKLELFKVRLNAIETSITNQLCIKPKEGSKVLVGIIENIKTEAVILSCSEVEEFFVHIGSAILRVKENKVKITAGNEDLKDALVDLKAEVKKISSELQKVVVLYGTSPNLPALVAIDASLDLIENRINTIFE